MRQPLIKINKQVAHKLALLWETRQAYTVDQENFVAK